MGRQCGPATLSSTWPTGMSACNAILLALLARDRLGRGQHVEVALFDIAVAMTGFYGMTYLMTGVNQSRFGNSPNGSPPSASTRQQTGRSTSPAPTTGWYGAS